MDGNMKKKKIQGQENQGRKNPKPKESAGGSRQNSFWLRDTKIPFFPVLSGEIRRDAVVIGGGMCGILIGYYLKQAGVRAVILEADTIGSGQTAGTTAKITSQHGKIYHTLVKNLGQERAGQYAEGNQRAVAEYGRLISERGIDCDFHKCGAYIYSMTDREAMEQEARSASACGINASFTQETELPFEVKGAVRFGGQARFSPEKFLGNLAGELEIYEHTQVLNVDRYEVYTSRGKVTAEHIIFACHYPFVNVPGFYFMRMYQQRSYVLALEQKGAQATKESGQGGLLLPENVYLGVDPGPGFSFRRAGDALLFGGYSHRTGEMGSGVSPYKKLALKARTWWPKAAVTAKWSAQDCMTLDQVPYIGKFSGSRENWYVATGFKKWGMTSSMVSAMVISGIITGNSPDWAPVFSPSRFTPKASAAEFSGHMQVSTVNLSKSFLMPPKKTPEDLKPGQGKIVEWKGKKTGVYMDEKGKLYPVSPRCPHLGCQLAFNPSEKSWDCPCHGSRFSYTGELLCGPAQTGIGLEEKKIGRGK